MVQVNPDLTCATDAASWRELQLLLGRLGYGRMAPAELAGLLPDLRAAYVAMVRPTVRPTWARRHGAAPGFARKQAGREGAVSDEREAV